MALEIEQQVVESMGPFERFALRVRTAAGRDPASESKTGRARQFLDHTGAFIRFFGGLRLAATATGAVVAAIAVLDQTQIIQQDSVELVIAEGAGGTTAIVSALVSSVWGSGLGREITRYAEPPDTASASYQRLSARRGRLRWAGKQLLE